MDITTALKNIFESESDLILSWSEVDIDFLNRCTINEYCQWLKEDSPNSNRLIKKFLNQSLGLPASKNLEQAIRTLAENSKLNKIRAKFIYNIDIDNPSNNVT